MLNPVLSIVERLGGLMSQKYNTVKLLWMFLQQGLSSSNYAGAG